MFCSVIDCVVDGEVIIIFNDGTKLRLARTGDIIAEYAIKLQKSIEDLHIWSSFEAIFITSKIDAVEIAKHAAFNCERKTVAQFLNFVIIERGAKYDQVIKTIKNLDLLRSAAGRRVVQYVLCYLAITRGK